MDQDQFKLSPIKWKGDPKVEIEEAYNDLEKKTNKKAKEIMEDVRKILGNKNYSDEVVFGIAKGLIEGSHIFVRDANKNIYILDKRKYDSFWEIWL